MCKPLKLFAFLEAPHLKHHKPYFEDKGYGVLSPL
jgi:hypothetical protein